MHRSTLLFRCAALALVCAPAEADGAAAGPLVGKTAGVQPPPAAPQPTPPAVEPSLGAEVLGSVEAAAGLGLAAIPGNPALLVPVEERLLHALGLWVEHKIEAMIQAKFGA